MKVLLISKDTSLFNEKGPSRNELLDSAKRVEELHVIVHTTKKDFKTFTKIDNVFLYPTNSLHPIFYIYDSYSIAKYQVTLKFHLIADLISAEDGFRAAIAAYIISWKYGKNFIMGIHKYFDELTYGDNIFVRAIKRDIQYFLMNRSAGIRVSSQSIGEEIYSQYPQHAAKIYILPFISEIEGVRLSTADTDIHKAYKKYNIILIQAGRTFSFPTIMRSVEIMNILRTRYKNIGLIIIGKINKPLLNWPRKLFLPKSIQFGKRAHDMTSYYRTANAFIDTSLVSGKDGEITNAALAGCPIVSGKTKASDEIIVDGDNGYIVDPKDSHRFARKIMDILEKTGVREEMRYARFNITEIYGKSLDGYTDRLTGIWESCKSTDETIAVAHIDKVATPLTPEKAAKSKAITMFVAEQVKIKLAKLPSILNPTLVPREGDNKYVLDLDKIKIGIEDALKEIEENPLPSVGDEDEIIEI